MDPGHYVNSAVDEGRNRPEKRENAHPGWSKVFWMVGISFALLCIIQSALNISLRLRGHWFYNKSDLINVTSMPNADVSVLELKTDRLEKENRELQDENNYLTGEVDMLTVQLGQLRDHIVELHTENERLMRLFKEQIVPCCPLGWTRYRFSCYQLSTERQTWRFAKDDCVAKGAHLVILSDESEEEVLHTLGRSDMWIGLKTKWQIGLRTWTWVDGSQLTQDHRIQLQPHDRRSHCVHWRRSPSCSVTWIGDNCADHHHWVCEKELEGCTTST